MNKHLFLMMMTAAAMTFAGCGKDDTADDAADDSVIKNGTTPPLASSTQTWKFGTLTWSDLIKCPECNKSSFTSSNTEPQCRSYAGRYYYNWAYVNANKNTLCPSPWRVPTAEDFNSLGSHTTWPVLISEWGYGGDAYGSSMEGVSTYAYYWSSTQHPSSTSSAYRLFYRSSNLYVDTYPKYYGFQVRCVAGTY
jgi:hypothetical protein